MIIHIVRVSTKDPALRGYVSLRAVSSPPKAQLYAKTCHYALFDSPPNTYLYAKICHYALFDTPAKT